MSQAVNEALQEFSADDYTWKLVSNIFKVVPYSPDLHYYASVNDAVRVMRPNASHADFEAARQAADSEEIQAVLKMARIMDTGDSGYAIYTGVRSAVSFFFGDRSKALETDTQQRNDAVLKALGISYMIYKAFPGGIADKTRLFRTTNAGQALAMYYGSIEVALPFADNAMVKGGGILDDLFSREGASQASRLASLAGGDTVSEAQGMLTQLTGQLKRITDHASNYVTPVAETAKQYLPGVMSTTDKVAGVVANAADVMPCYRLLGARLAAEAAVIRALGEGAPQS